MPHLHQTKDHEKDGESLAFDRALPVFQASFSNHILRIAGHAACHAVLTYSSLQQFPAILLCCKVVYAPLTTSHFRRPRTRLP